MPREVLKVLVCDSKAAGACLSLPERLANSKQKA